MQDAELLRFEDRIELARVNYKHHLLEMDELAMRVATTEKYNEALKLLPTVQGRIGVFCRELRCPCENCSYDEKIQLRWYCEDTALLGRWPLTICCAVWKR